jgi:hypothetical protein
MDYQLGPLLRNMVAKASGLRPLVVDALEDELGLLYRPVDELGLGHVGLGGAEVSKRHRLRLRSLDPYTIGLWLAHTSEPLSFESGSRLVTALPSVWHVSAFFAKTCSSK